MTPSRSCYRPQSDAFLPTAHERRVSCALSYHNLPPRRPREDKIVNTLRRLSLTLKKRRLFIGDNELASGGQRAGSKKAKGGGEKARHTVVTAATAAAVAERNASQNGNGDAGNETVTLVERVTGKAIEVTFQIELINSLHHTHSII